MIPDPFQPFELSGQLLLASPALLEPTFFRTVVLLTDHTEKEGALGYILNRPLGQLVSDVLPPDEFGDLGNVPIYMGGPVSQEHLTFSSLHWNEAAGKLDYKTHLSANEASARCKEGFAVRAYVGYSGWSEGQLENELKDDAWVVKDPIRELTEAERLNSALWGNLIRDVGPEHRLAADMPDDLSLN